MKQVYCVILLLVTTWLALVGVAWSEVAIPRPIPTRPFPSHEKIRESVGHSQGRNANSRISVSLQDQNKKDCSTDVGVIITCVGII